MKASFFASIFIFGMASLPAFTHAATTRIGNGDEGSDLEGFSEVSSGAIADSRTQAVKLLNSLNIPGMPGLGMLLPEVESTKLYLTKKDVTAVQASDQNQFHADMKGRVYARTFAEPHAATRFFPVAEKLDADQLVALQIHEGLHRSLPPNIREDENIVAQITLAITAPGANFDSIHAVVRKYIADAPTQASVNASEAVPLSDTSRAKNPSVFSYEYRSFRKPSDDTGSFTVNSLHLIETELYPFLIGDAPFGLGLKFSYVNRPSTSFMGPLELSGKLRIWSYRGFDVGAWVKASLNTLSDAELKQSQFGRDNYELGISIQKDANHFSVENYLSYLFPGTSTQKFGNIEYEYGYGSVITASTHPALRIGAFRIGGFFELMLGDYYRVSGGAFSYDPGRYRLVSVGPEIQYRIDNVVIGLSGRFLIDATEDANFDSLGDLMGPGVAQGNISGQISIFF